jgi:hypothetical protein
VNGGQAAVALPGSVAVAIPERLPIIRYFHDTPDYPSHPSSQHTYPRSDSLTLLTPRNARTNASALCLAGAPTGSGTLRLGTRFGAWQWGHVA